MFDLLTLTNIEDYFKTKSQRKENGVYFYRIIGYDEAFLEFLRQYQTCAQRKGVYINKTIKNPDPSDVQYLYTQIKSDIEIKQEKIKSQCKMYLKFLNDNQICMISDAIYNVLEELKSNGLNLNIINNSYIKFLFWLKYVFENCIKYIDQDEIPKILYEGDIGKYELYMLRVLSLAGCDILYINFLSEESYMKYDSQGKYSLRIIKPIRQNPPLHFSKIDLRQIEEKKKAMDDLKKFPYKLNTNMWINDNFLDEIFKDNRSQDEIKNLFVGYVGIDEFNEYNNRLYNLKNSIEKSKKNFYIIEKGIQMPSLNEISKYRFEYKNKEDILLGITKIVNFINDEKINKAIKIEITNIIMNSKEKNLTKLYNMTLKLICWVERYSKILFNNFNWNQLPILIYFRKL